MTMQIPCPIWGANYVSEVNGVWTSARGEIHFSQDSLIFSPRTGGYYRLTEEADRKIRYGSLNNEVKARLTTWLIDQRNQGDPTPTISSEVVAYVSKKYNLQVFERAERLLEYLTKQVDTIGAGVNVQQDSFSAYAWSESVKWEEVVYLLNYLRESGWLEHVEVIPKSDNRIDQRFGLERGIVTVAGFNKVASQLTNVDSAQAFVALWFNQEMNLTYDNGIVPALESTGFKPYRADREHYLGKIDDQIIAEIRRSRFLIADMTHGDDGARGSVYFEAGFALGLGIPVIYTCQEDMFKQLHFDTRQYPHIGWAKEELESFRKNLENRIRATVV